jgi:hypothetical protein
LVKDINGIRQLNVKLWNFPKLLRLFGFLELLLKNFGDDFEAKANGEDEKQVEGDDGLDGEIPMGLFRKIIRKYCWTFEKIFKIHMIITEIPAAIFEPSLSFSTPL